MRREEQVVEDIGAQLVVLGIELYLALLATRFVFKGHHCLVYHDFFQLFAKKRDVPVASFLINLLVESHKQRFMCQRVA